MIKINGFEVVPTIFPDKTSQVWKIDDAAQVGTPNRLQNIHQPTSYHDLVEWVFESEAEIFHVVQLVCLMRKSFITKNRPSILKIAFMPYSRQDKAVANDSTFAFECFKNSIFPLFDEVRTIDIHNPKSIETLKNVKNILPNDKIEEVIQLTSADISCFPDAGATKRGYYTGNLPAFHLEKKRNQLTGVIEGLGCPLPLNLKGRKVLILDDICDGGKTFIEAAKVLYAEGADEVCLYTSHGIYSKGLEVLFDAKIKRIFNYQGEVYDPRTLVVEQDKYFSEVIQGMYSRQEIDINKFDIAIAGVCNSDELFECMLEFDVYHTDSEYQGVLN